MSVRRRKIDTYIEELIITGMIVSTEFMKSIVGIMAPEIFEVDFVKRVSRWCIDYFSEYKSSPKESIQHIFNIESSKISDEEKEIIRNFLNSLSEKYESFEGQINDQYLTDKAIQYIKKRKLKLTSEKVSSYLELDMVDAAEDEFSSYKKVIAETASWVNPFEKEYVKKIFSEYNDEKYHLFKLPGALGEVTGWFERENLIGIIAPMKRYKSWILEEIAIQGILEKRKVVLFSLEMSARKISQRIYRRLTGLAKKETGNYLYPVFDCLENQDGSCSKQIRKNKSSLVKSLDEELPKWQPELEYEACSLCRGTRDFRLGFWWMNRRVEKIKYSTTKPIIDALVKMYGDNFRIFSYPAFSANFSRMKRDLEKLEVVEGFHGDILLYDYAEIFGDESGDNGDERSKIDKRWKMLKGQGDEKHACVVTVSQTGEKKSLDKKILQQSDAAGDVRKNAHVDKMYTINQTPEEKRRGVFRFGVVADRDEGFDSLSSCYVLQQLDVGQIALDSEILR